MSNNLKAADFDFEKFAAYLKTCKRTDNVGMLLIMHIRDIGDSMNYSPEELLTMIDLIFDMNLVKVTDDSNESWELVNA